MRRAARWLLNVGTAAIVFTLAKVHAAFVGSYDFTNSPRLAWALTYVALLCAAAYSVGLPDLPLRGQRSLGPAVVATIFGALGISVIQLLAGSALLPRYVVLGGALALVPFYALCATVSRGGSTRAEQRERVLAVVSDEERAALERDLGRNPERPASIAGVLHIAEACGDSEADAPLVAHATSVNATLLVLDRVAQGDDRVVRQAATLHEGGVRVRTLSLFYDEWLGKLPVSELERVSLMFDIGEIHRARYGRFKRLADIALACVGLVALIVVTPVVILGNLVGNRGPLFFRQDRIGRGGAVFRIAKFRTMRTSPRAGDWTEEDDPRITPFGRWLRRTHVDELPQMVNVLAGDLAIVGPRPEQPQYVEELAVKIPFYRLRHAVRPGLTGWAQVKYAYGGTTSDALEKLQYEFFYLRHQGLWLDARILLRTLRSVVARSGR